MPSLGATMDAGTLVEWKVKPGDHVEHGDIVAVVNTDKAALEVEIFDTGEIEKILVEEGEKVPVGTALATVHVEGEPAVKKEAEAPAAEPAAAEPSAAEPGPPTKPTAPRARPAVHRGRVSPAARRLARELGLDPNSIAGHGPGGAVTLSDIEAAAAPEVVREGRREQVMHALGAAMEKSKREIPHYYLALDIDVGDAQDWLRSKNANRPPAERVLFAALLYKAVARALPAVPQLNGYFRDGAFAPATSVHIGIAISLRHGGTVAPAIHDVDAMPVDTLMAALSDLTRRTRAGSLRGSELSDSTITVTSLGDEGPDTVIGVIYPPQVALVGFGAVRLRPWVVEGELAVRPIVTASLSADHRASEGREGARFLSLLADQLKRPEEL